MSQEHHDLLARLILLRISTPGDTGMGQLVHRLTPTGVVEALRSGDNLDAFRPEGKPTADWAQACQRWRTALAKANPEADLEAGQKLEADLVIPGDPDWPAQMNDLGAAAPHALWVRGEANVAPAFDRSIAIVGARAATPYGVQVAFNFAGHLGSNGWNTISGGARGIDYSAHRGALAAGGPTIAVLASGVDITYPSGHRRLFQAIMAHGALVSEAPIGVRPARHRFLSRNRIVAVSRATVVVEAALHSGTMNTARHAHDLGRLLAAVPGLVTSEQSRGCHRLMSRGHARCVSAPRELLDLLQP
ncbi:DNA-processing protein DprA [Nonomuraea maheshkhaliensis]|uniref:DNA-processing protein DprA n=1 Tax=Nonomuraea maheshkhaliensis TaxID=419590 RepID=A0ABN2EZI5_9ACTN